ncbi:MAG: hypothetical protein RTV31_16785 [Candidatus Thorarchaeota archaeon]
MSSNQLDRTEEAELRSVLEEAYNLIHTDEHETNWNGKFLNIMVGIDIASHQYTELRPIVTTIKHVNQDVWNTCILIYRLEWLRSMLTKHRSLPDYLLWNMSSSIDIEHFHVELRSILDYIANILGIIAVRPKQVRSDSFRRLYEWVIKSDSNKDKLGWESSELILSASWYADLRGTRDFVVHYGDHTMVFGEPRDGIFFQVFGNSFNPRIDRSYLMQSDNMVDFRLYAGMYLARIIVFLERLGELLGNTLADRVPQQDRNVRCNWMGLQTLKEWIGMLIARIDSDT